MNSCQNFPSSVMRPIRSRTRVSIGRDAFRYGTVSRPCADATGHGASSPVRTTAMRSRRIDPESGAGGIVRPEGTAPVAYGARLRFSQNERSMERRIVAISGSLRTGSSNTVLLRAARLIAPRGLAVALYDGIDRLPFFNPDLDG